MSTDAQSQLAFNQCYFVLFQRGGPKSHWTPWIQFHKQVSNANIFAGKGTFPSWRKPINQRLNEIFCGRPLTILYIMVYNRQIYVILVIRY